MVELGLETRLPDWCFATVPSVPHSLRPRGQPGAAPMGIAQHWMSQSRPLQKGFSALCSEGTCSHPYLPSLLREHLWLLSPTWLSWLCRWRTWSSS